MAGLPGLSDTGDQQAPGGDLDGGSSHPYKGAQVTELAGCRICSPLVGPPLLFALCWQESAHPSPLNGGWVPLLRGCSRAPPIFMPMTAVAPSGQDHWHFSGIAIIFSLLPTFMGLRIHSQMVHISCPSQFSCKFI